MKDAYRLGELFCGPGGLASGALSARIEDPHYRIVHAWATDYSEDACRTYTQNICPDDPDSVICQDVRELDMSCLPAVDGLAFGFPCNDYSCVGKQKGLDGKYGPLYSYCVKALEVLRPEWFVAENVSGLQSANGGAAFQRILDEFADQGYNLVTHLYRFEDYGVPQARHRVFIVGIRKDIDAVFRVPSPVAEKRTCRQAIEEPPIPLDTPNHEFARMSPLTIERLSYIRPGENAFNADLPEHLRLNVKGATISSIYKRLDPEKPAYTVTGSGGGVRTCIIGKS